MSLVNDGNGNMVMPVSPMGGGYGLEVENMIHKLEAMKPDAPDREIKMAIDNMIRKLEAY